jgi:hypothetical protein
VSDFFKKSDTCRDLSGSDVELPGEVRRLFVESLVILWESVA